jgi:hypothetical protein
LVGVAVKVTEPPVQIVFVDSEMETEAVIDGLIVTTIGKDVAVGTDKQGVALEVI